MRRYTNFIIDSSMLWRRLTATSETSILIMSMNLSGQGLSNDRCLRVVKAADTII
ncbi:MAG: hypothetical protein JWQ79_1886 [Mucilaginibacter sp.]|nr:hypothetical protein [Mucilaginibacter sp.]